MFDFSEAERQLIADMATVGHSMTDRGAELLRRLHELVSYGPPEPAEYPKMVYPEGLVHQEGEGDQHMVGKPRGVLVNSEKEERAILGPDAAEMRVPTVDYASESGAAVDVEREAGPVLADSSSEPQ